MIFLLGIYVLLPFLTQDGPIIMWVHVQNDVFDKSKNNLHNFFIFQLQIFFFWHGLVCYLLQYIDSWDGKKVISSWLFFFSDIKLTEGRYWYLASSVSGSINIILDH